MIDRPILDTSNLCYNQFPDQTESISITLFVPQDESSAEELTWGATIVKEHPQS